MNLLIWRQSKFDQISIVYCVNEMADEKQYIVDFDLVDKFLSLITRASAERGESPTILGNRIQAITQACRRVRGYSKKSKRSQPESDSESSSNEDEEEEEEPRKRKAYKEWHKKGEKEKV